MVCKKCGQSFEDGFNNCPNCGESVNGKTKKPIFKKWWFWLIIVFVVFVVIGSIGGSDEPSTQPDTTVNGEVIDGDSDVITTTTTTTNAGPAQTWSKNFYTDDFDEPTDEWYVSRTFIGTFSNSATSDSRLKGDILIDAEDISIFLYEYYTHQVKNPYSRSESYVISVRLENGTTKTFDGYIYSDGDRIMVDDGDVAALKNLLVNGGKMKFYIYEKDNSVTNYLFEISSDNLKNVLGK